MTIRIVDPTMRQHPMTSGGQRPFQNASASLAVDVAYSTSRTSPTLAACAGHGRTRDAGPFASTSSQRRGQPRVRGRPTTTASVAIPSTRRERVRRSSRPSRASTSMATAVRAPRCRFAGKAFANHGALRLLRIERSSTSSSATTATRNSRCTATAAADQATLSYVRRAMHPKCRNRHQPPRRGFATVNR